MLSLHALFCTLRNALLSHALFCSVTLCQTADKLKWNNYILLFNIAFLVSISSNFIEKRSEYFSYFSRRSPPPQKNRWSALHRRKRKAKRMRKTINGKVYFEEWYKDTYQKRLICQVPWWTICNLKVITIWERGLKH